jgi:hypothetical protein
MYRTGPLARGKERGMNLPDVVSQEEWKVARWWQFHDSYEEGS